jgi:hypothetical protein
MFNVIMKMMETIILMMIMMMMMMRRRMIIMISLLDCLWVSVTLREERIFIQCMPFIWEVLG